MLTLLPLRPRDTFALGLGFGVHVLECVYEREEDV